MEDARGDLLDKRFYKINDVSLITGVPQPTLRYWEKEFTRLKPKRNRGGTRLYTPADIELIRRIRYLVHDKGLKIQAAREALRDNGDELSRRLGVIERLKEIRERLLGLDAALAGRRTEPDK